MNRITHLPYTTEPDIQPTPLLTVRPPRLPPRPPKSPRTQPETTSPVESPAQPDGPDPRLLSAPTSPIQPVSPLPPSPTISGVDRPKATPILNAYTLHRLALTSLLIACKFSVDGTLSQTRAAKVGGVTPHELCKLEGEGLRLLGWSLMWSLEEIEDACRELEQKGEELGVLEPLQAERDAATPRPGASESAAPDAPDACDDPLPRSPPRAGANAFYLQPLDDDEEEEPRSPPSRRSSQRRMSNPYRDTSLSAASSVPSSEASTSQASSEASSPLISLKSTGVAAFRQNLLPDADEHGRLSRRGSRSAGDGAEGGRERVSPPSSPSATSVEEESDRDLEEKDSDLVGACTTRNSMETIRNVESLTLAG